MFCKRISECGSQKPYGRHQWGSQQRSINFVPKLRLNFYAWHVEDVLFPGVSTVGMFHTIPFYKIQCKIFLKDVYYAVLLDGRHRPRSVVYQRDEDGGAWAADPLRTNYAFRADVKAISAGLVISPSKITNIFTSCLQRKAAHTYTMHITFSNA